MGLINLEPTLRDGEQIRWRKPAAHCVSERTVPGTLFVTTQALVFMPNRLNRRRDLVAHRIAVADVESVGVQERSATITQRAALRRRVRVRTAIGDTFLFVVNNPDAAARELSTLLHDGS